MTSMSYVLSILCRVHSKGWHCHAALQLDSYLGTLYWGIEDTRYVKMVKLFEAQQQYAGYDKTDDWPFTNIFDRGYHVVLDGAKCGKQIYIQPAFTDNANKFTTNKVLYLAAIATKQSGNGRAVKQVKTSWLLK